MGRRIMGWKALALVVAVAACASPRAGADANASPASGSPNLITRAEINRAQWRDTFELVRHLRPRWMATRGADTFLGKNGQVQVYVDGTRLGDVDLLKGMPTTAIDHLEWIDPISAAGRWGSGHGHGVIAVSYRPFEP